MTIITKQDGTRQLPLDEPRLRAFIEKMAGRYPQLDTADYVDKAVRTVAGKTEYKASQITNMLTLNALSNIGTDEGQHPDWTYLAANIYLHSLYKEASKNRCYDANDKYGNLYGLLNTLTTEGVYTSKLLRDYSKEEIEELEKVIEPERDHLFSYIGLVTLAERYLATNKAKAVYELPQERFLIIAMALMSQEKENRLELVKQSYWAMSSLYMTVATPTLSNAGKAYGQLSSCFIDTVHDSLEGIYDSNTDIARLSRDGGGIGVYLGKIRSRGSDIRGFKGASSGIVPWTRQLNNTAVNVDQLGNRQGAVAVYLDAWHKDIFSFLDLRLNNGDERLRAHDVFTGVCVPDIFMEKVESREDWYLFDPHEVLTKKGWSLEDHFDEERGKGSFRDKYNELINNNNISKTRVPAIDVFKAIMKSQLETGTPYMFYRDTVNRANANKHVGMIYCSNLCVEITQPMSATVTTSEILTEDGRILIEKKAGDFVVCNLSSINLGRAVIDDVLEDLIPIQVRMLDNVIELNTIQVLQAVHTNKNMRAVGLGTFGLHHLLALKGIHWESEEAVAYNDELYEKIAYLTIQASMNLAIEKGAYPKFEGSEWENGMYFERRGYVSDKWQSLRQAVADNGIRNSHLMAVAPNGSTAIIGNSTSSVDPIFKRQYSEEKKNYKIPVCAPDLSAKTFWFYKNAYEVDQLASIKMNAARQRHIDQSQSFNIYVHNDIKASKLLEIHLEAWKNGLKTTYYVRSTSVQIDECESCFS